VIGLLTTFATFTPLNIDDGPAHSVLFNVELIEPRF